MEIVLYIAIVAYLFVVAIFFIAFCVYFYGLIREKMKMGKTVKDDRFSFTPDYEWWCLNLNCVVIEGGNWYDDVHVMD